MRGGLAGERCTACEGGTPPLERAEAASLLADVSERWRLAEDAGSIACEVTLASFAAAMRFVNAMAAVAEEEGHHPDFAVHGWNQVGVSLRTHAIDGLSRNDFILAAKIDDILASGARS